MDKITITVQRKYAHRKKNLNAKLIKSNYLCHGTVIHLTLVILLSSDLQTILTQIEMKRQIGKTDRNLFSRLMSRYHVMINLCINIFRNVSIIMTLSS